MKNKKIAVVVPCYNEAKQIVKVLDTIPEFVDLVIVINDKSTDSTETVVKEFINNDNSNKIKLEKNMKELKEDIKKEIEIEIEITEGDNKWQEMR